MDPRRWEEIRAGFDEIVGLEAVDRADRLAAIGATDPELRDAVEALLSADGAMDSRPAAFERPVLSPALGAAVGVTPPEPMSDPLGLAGRTVSHFRLQEPLGAGGMGVVYRAEDTRLERAVALKFLLPQYGLDAFAKQRFLREARSAAALDHPNLCTIHEVGETEEGELYLAMTLYAGETLKTRLAREGPLGISDALAIARQIAEGLACAHAAGIVHRDLKPGNLMLLPDGALKVLDFGLAKAKDASLTGSGTLLGTVAYMAPEQIHGASVDARADLWALGVVLYEILTGRRPFEGEHDISVAHAILHDEPGRPSALRAGVPPGVEAVILRLLEKDPARRYATAREVLRALAAARADTETARVSRHSGSARFDTDHSRQPRWLRHVSHGVIVLGGVALALGAGLTWRTYSLGAPGDVPLERSIAVLPFDNRSAEKETELLAGGLQDAIITQLSKFTDLQVSSRQSTRVYAGSAKPLRQIAHDLGVATILHGSVQRMGERLRVMVQLIDAKTDTHLWANEYERVGTDLFALQNEIALAIVEAFETKLTTAERERLTRPPTRNAQAYNFYLKGREYQQRATGPFGSQDIEAAEGLFRRAVALDPEFALAHAQLAQTHADRYWFSNHTPALLEETRIEAEAAIRLQPDLPEARLAMGRYWYISGRENYPRALDEYEIARRGMPNDAQVHMLLAAVYRRQGRWDEALAGFRRALDLDPRNSLKAWELATTYQYMRRYAEAARAWDYVTAIAPDNRRFQLEKGYFLMRWLGATDSLAAALNRIPADWNPNGAVTRAHVDLASLQRRPADAVAALAAMRPEVLDSRDSENTSFLKLMRGLAYQALGDTARARADFELARAILDTARIEHPDNAHVYADLAVVDAALGRKRAAVREAQRAMDMLPLSKDPIVASLLIYHAAETYARVGDVAAAVTTLERLLTMPTFLGIPSVQELRLDPRWDPLRHDPDFQRLVERK